MVDLCKGRLKHDTFGSTTGRPEIGRKTTNFGIMDIFEEAGNSGNIFHQIRIHLEFIKNTQSIRTGIEKYLGLIAGRKFTGNAAIGRMDREARGGSIYEIRTWWQLPGMVCGKRSMRCCSKNDHSMRSDT